MSISASDGLFMSALQPNNSVTTYALPAEIHIGNGGTMSDEVAKAKRVQQQVKMRLAEKSTLPRQNGSTSQYAISDYGGPSTMQHYNTYSPNYSSRSAYAMSGSRTIGPPVAHRSGFSSHSVGPELSQFHRMSIGAGGAGGGGGGFYQEDVRMGGYQGNARQNRMETETMSMHSMRQPMQVNQWMVDGSDAGSLISERDATFGRQYAHSAVNGQIGQGSLMYTSPMRRSLSGTLSRGAGMTGGGAEIVQQHSFKGPAHRTISRITNRNRMSMGSMSGTLQHQMSSSGSSLRGGATDMVDQGFILPTMSSGSQGNLVMQQRPGTLSRAMSVKSMQSVGKGMDIFYDTDDMRPEMVILGGKISSLDMVTAVQHLSDPDPDMQVLGAAFIQHQCYSDADAKEEVRDLNGIGELIKLFNSENEEVRRYATGATRNLIYENMENKMVLIKEGGIPLLVNALRETDEELRKNITGILWNLSSKESLKEKLATETLSALSEKILVPLAAKQKEKADVEKDEDSARSTESHSETEIFCNTTGCLRNLSSVSQKTRDQMRETKGLVESLVEYIEASLKNNAESKGVENSMCVLRNLSYQLYNEIPSTYARRLDGPTRDQDNERGDTVGCFTPNSRKAKNKKKFSLGTLSEVSREPKGMEWLWHPQIVGVYNRLLQSCEANLVTREAAIGCLQNITAGDKRWASVMSAVVTERERMVPSLLNYLRTTDRLEMRSLTGLLRNVSRHANNKDDMSTKVVGPLVDKLPERGIEEERNVDMVLNICGALNNLVTGSSLAARDIAYFDGLPKLMEIKNSQSSPGRMKAAKAAATVLTNMYHYKKWHKEYKAKGFSKEDFVDHML